VTVVIWQQAYTQQEILYCTGFTESGKIALKAPELPSPWTPSSAALRSQQPVRGLLTLAPQLMRHPAGP